jgi:hypothetical protein
MRKIVKDSNCPMCGKVAESSGHSLWWCEASQAVWAEASKRIQKCTSDEDDFLTIFSHLSDNLDRETLEWFTMVAQRIW